MVLGPTHFPGKENHYETSEHPGRDRSSHESGIAGHGFYQETQALYLYLLCMPLPRADQNRGPMPPVGEHHELSF